jgi:hypothetical protein
VSYFVKIKVRFNYTFNPQPLSHVSKLSLSFEMSKTFPPLTIGWKQIRLSKRERTFFLLKFISIRIKITHFETWNRC